MLSHHPLVPFLTGNNEFPCSSSFLSITIVIMVDSKVPSPGPAKLKRNAGPEEWLEAAKDCKYLSEPHMKQLCEMVKEYMMEGTRPLLPVPPALLY